MLPCKSLVPSADCPSGFFSLLHLFHLQNSGHFPFLLPVNTLSSACLRTFAYVLPFAWDSLTWDCFHVSFLPIILSELGCHLLGQPFPLPSFSSEFYSLDFLHSTYSTLICLIYLFM